MDDPSIESFRLYGLHGYKNVEIDFYESDRIVMAENGSGKTTVLSALAAFLNSEFDGLQKLPFERLECKFRGSNLTLQLDQSLLRDLYSAEDIRDFARSIDVPPTELRRLITGQKTTDEIVDQLWIHSTMPHRDFYDAVKFFRIELNSGLPDEVRIVSEEVAAIMGGTNVLHHPTYRRIEASLQPSALKRGQAMRSKKGIHRDERFPNSGVGVRYGLSDVEDRLSSLVGGIQRLSNHGYRQISATIIDDLLAGGLDTVELGELPSIDSLRLFFSRIDQGGSSNARTERLAELYNQGGIDSGSRNTLKYFLSKLAVVIGETEELESNIEEFVDRVNVYLGMSSDEKVLLYNSTEMRVQVINTWTGNIVKMNDLSSGEKQVVSLFSYLYLHADKNIVLIDEPELSLSIEWQRRLLMDVIDSPACLQLLAITHSPFIFDNELDPIAGPMVVRRTDALVDE